MYRTPHDGEYGMKVWLSGDEVEAFLELVDDSTHRLAFALGLRCGLRSSEIVAVTPDDLVDGPAGHMMRVREEYAKFDKYRETPVPTPLASTIRAVGEHRPEPSDAPLVDASRRSVRRWVSDAGDTAAEEFDDEGWRDLSAHDFRRTWATLLAGAEDVDPLLVCQWGGWEELETFLDHYRGAYSPEVQRRARDGVEWL